MSKRGAYKARPKRPAPPKPPEPEEPTATTDKKPVEEPELGKSFTAKIGPEGVVEKYEPEIPPEVQAIRDRVFGPLAPPPAGPSPGAESAGAPAAPGPGEVPTPHVGRPTSDEARERRLAELAQYFQAENLKLFREMNVPWPAIANQLLSVLGDDFKLDPEEKEMFLNALAAYDATHLPSSDEIPGIATKMLVFVIISILVKRTALGVDKWYLQPKKKEKEGGRPGPDG